MLRWRFHQFDLMSSWGSCGWVGYILEIQVSRNLLFKRTRRNRVAHERHVYKSGNWGPRQRDCLTSVWCNGSWRKGAVWGKGRKSGDRRRREQVTVWSLVVLKYGSGGKKHTKSSETCSSQSRSLEKIYQRQDSSPFPEPRGMTSRLPSGRTAHQDLSATNKGHFFSLRGKLIITNPVPSSQRYLGSSQEPPTLPRRRSPH